MHTFGQVLALVLQIYFVLLIFRLIMEYVFIFARSFRPSGVLAVALELTYTVTDPPLKAVRRVLPPLRVGNFSLDLGFLVVIIVVQILAGVAASL
jgi:YggT family protein